jgi:hypothetical protein
MTNFKAGFQWTPFALDHYLQYLSFTQLGLISRMRDVYYRYGFLDTELAALAFSFNVEEADIKALWTPRFEVAWAAVKEYIDVLTDSDTDYQGTQLAASLLGVEAKRTATGEEEAQEVLGELFPIYEAFIQQWSDKKITIQDCEKIKQLVETGKTTAEQMIEALIAAKKQAEHDDKVKYMPCITKWLKEGRYKAAKTANGIPDKLAKANAEGKDAILAKLAGKK